MICEIFQEVNIVDTWLKTKDNTLKFLLWVVYAGQLNYANLSIILSRQYNKKKHCIYCLCNLHMKEVNVSFTFVPTYFFQYFSEPGKVMVVKILKKKTLLLNE